MKETFIPNFYEESDKLYSLTKDRKSIYGEPLISRGEMVYRLFSPLRSKFSSSLKLGLKPAIKKDDHILYLGAATGTTASHLSDSVSSGLIFPVEISPVPFIKLTTLAEVKKNILPILSDVQRPETYGVFVDKVDLVYQDVSQPNQVDIFSKNMKFFRAKRGVLMLKTYSLRSDRSVREAIKEIEKNFTINQFINISRFYKGHYAAYLTAN